MGGVAGVESKQKSTGENVYRLEENDARAKYNSNIAEKIRLSPRHCGA